MKSNAPDVTANIQESAAGARIAARAV